MQQQLIRELVALLGSKGVLSQAEDLMMYEYDGSVETGSPKCIVSRRPRAEVSKLCASQIVMKHRWSGAVRERVFREERSPATARIVIGFPA